MPISSLIVQARNGHVEAVAERLRAFPELEVTGGQGDQLVVVAETENRKHDREVYRRIEHTEEVMALNLIYVNFEDLED
jgi:nitrate reductase NapAB chaperone NapD